MDYGAVLEYGGTPFYHGSKASTPFVEITVQGCEKVSVGTILLLWPSYTQ